MKKKKHVPKDIKNYFSELGKIGGKKSKRKLTTEQAKKMIKKRWNKRKD